MSKQSERTSVDTIAAYLNAYNTGLTTSPKVWCEDNNYSVYKLRKLAKQNNVLLPFRANKNPSLDSLITKDTVDPWLVGHLLGDGSIVPRKDRSTNLSFFAIACKHDEYIEWLVQNNPLLVKSESKVYLNDTVDKRTSVNSHIAWAKTRSSSLLAEYRKVWYPEGKKKIPLDIKPTSLSWLIFYMEDGYTKKGKSVQLSVNDFSEEAIDYLREDLSANNIDTGVGFDQDKLAKIYIRQGSRQAFFEYIGKCPVKCFEYKWDDCRL